MSPFARTLFRPTVPSCLLRSLRQARLCIETGVQDIINNVVGPFARGILQYLQRREETCGKVRSSLHMATEYIPSDALTDSYGPGKSYNIFAGKDGSKGLGKSSLKPEDAVADYSDLDESERRVLDEWYNFFSQRYNVIGKVVESTATSMPTESKPTSS